MITVATSNVISTAVSGNHNLSQLTALTVVLCYYINTLFTTFIFSSTDAKYFTGFPINILVILLHLHDYYYTVRLEVPKFLKVYFAPKAGKKHTEFPFHMYTIFLPSIYLCDLLQHFQIKQRDKNVYSILYQTCFYMKARHLAASTFTLFSTACNVFRKAVCGNLKGITGSENPERGTRNHISFHP